MTATVGLPARLRALSLAMLERALSDWTEMCGCATSVGDGSVVSHSGRDKLAAALPKNLITVETRLEGRCQGPTYFCFPSALAAHALGKFVILTPDAVAEKARTGLLQADLEAFQELANLLCGSSNNVLAAKDSGLRLSQCVEALNVYAADTADDVRFADLPEGSVAAVAIEVTIDDHTDHIHHVIPVDLARQILA